MTKTILKDYLGRDCIEIDNEKGTVTGLIPGTFAVYLQAKDENGKVVSPIYELVEEKQDEKMPSRRDSQFNP
jgi:hypothetical protein